MIYGVITSVGLWAIPLYYIAIAYFLNHFAPNINDYVYEYDPVLHEVHGNIGMAYNLVRKGGK